MAAGITIDDLLAAFSTLAKPADGSEGRSVAELAEQYQCTERQVLKALHLKRREGTLRRGRKPHERIDGIITTVACYWTETPPVPVKRKGS